MEILLILTVWLLTILTLGLGILAAQYLKEPEGFRKYISNLPPKRKPVTVGPVPRPTASEVNRRGTVEEATETEMMKILRKVGLKPKGEE